MVEYWRRPDATAATLVDGWVRTGDAGRLDEDGYLYLHDRLNDMIVVGGENVYPAEVENVLARHPAVADVAVVGVPDDVTGESVMAYVQCRPGASVTSRELLLSAREHLAAFKLPRRYEVIDRIPRNPSGKVLRRELREPHWADLDRRVN
jgi:long-chain acyl-CoA synthetase